MQIGSFISPTVCLVSPLNPISIEDRRTRADARMVSLFSASRSVMLTKDPPSTRILRTGWLAMQRVITNPSWWGSWISSLFVSLKVNSFLFLIDVFFWDFSSFSTQIPWHSFLLQKRSSTNVRTLRDYIDYLGVRRRGSYFFYILVFLGAEEEPNPGGWSGRVFCLGAL